MPFFNKIRKDQIKSEELKRYILYAFGEISLVMIGIPLSRKENKKETPK